MLGKTENCRISYNATLLNSCAEVTWLNSISSCADSDGCIDFSCIDCKIV